MHHSVLATADLRARGVPIGRAAAAGPRGTQETPGFSRKNRARWPRGDRNDGSE